MPFGEIVANPGDLKHVVELLRCSDGLGVACGGSSSCSVPFADSLADLLVFVSGAAFVKDVHNTWCQSPKMGSITKDDFMIGCFFGSSMRPVLGCINADLRDQRIIVRQFLSSALSSPDSFKILQAFSNAFFHSI